jgi:hypothetical protein
MSESNFWDGFWIVNQHISLPKTFNDTQNLDATWYSVTVYNTPLTAGQVNGVFQKTRKRFNA